MSKKKFSFVAASLVMASIVAVSTVSPANAWDAWGPVPVQYTTMSRVADNATSIPFSFDSIFKPQTINGSATSQAVDVEWDFFYSSFASGYGSCTTNSTPGAYDCPGGITVQVTNPDETRYTVSGVELVDRTDWSTWHVFPDTSVTSERAAALVVHWTSGSAEGYRDTITEAHFPADSILLPSSADKLIMNNFMPGTVMFHGAGAFSTDRNGYTQYTGSMLWGGAASTNSTSELAATGSNPWRDIALATGILILGAGLRLGSRIRFPK